MLRRNALVADSGYRNILRKVPSGSALYYPALPEGFEQGVIKDYSGNNNHGTITGATWTRLPSGLWGLDLNGTANEIRSANNLPASVLGTNSRYAEFWARTESVTGDRAYFSFGVNAANTIFGGIIVSGNYYFWGGAGSDWATGVAVTQNTWQHHRVYFDTTDDTVHWFINDSQLAAGATRASINTGTSVLYIGSQFGTLAFFDGQIALPRVGTGTGVSSFNRERHLFGV